MGAPKGMKVCALRVPRVLVLASCPMVARSSPSISSPNCSLPGLSVCSFVVHALHANRCATGPVTVEVPLVLLEMLHHTFAPRVASSRRPVVAVHLVDTRHKQRVLVMLTSEEIGTSINILR